MILAMYAAAVLAIGQVPPGQVAASIGLSGTGKSRIVKMADAAGAWDRRIVFDPCAKLDREEHAAGHPTYPWEGNLVTHRQLMEHPEWLNRSPLKLVVDPETDDERFLGPRFAALAELVWHTRGLQLICEECAAYARPAERLIKRMATRGRHGRVGLVLITQRLAQVPIDGRQGITRLAAFHTNEPADIEALRDRCGEEFAERVRRLPAPPVLAEPCLWEAGKTEVT